MRRIGPDESVDHGNLVRGHASNTIWVSKANT